MRMKHLWCLSLVSHRPLGVWQVASAGCSIPGTVWVSGKAAFSTGLPIHTTTVKGDLGNACVWSQIQLLLWRQSDGLWFKKDSFKTVFTFFMLFKSDRLLCRCQFFAFVMHNTQDELSLVYRSSLQKSSNILTYCCVLLAKENPPSPH